MTYRDEQDIWLEGEIQREVKKANAPLLRKVAALEHLCVEMGVRVAALEAKIADLERRRAEKQ